METLAVLLKGKLTTYSYEFARCGVSSRFRGWRGNVERENQFIEISPHDDAAGKFHSAAAGGFACKADHLLDMLRAKLPPVPPHTFIKTADQAFRKHAQRPKIIGLQRCGILCRGDLELQRLQQVARSDAASSAVLPGESLETIFYQRVPEHSFLPRQAGELAEMADNGWRKILFEQWQ